MRQILSSNKNIIGNKLSFNDHKLHPFSLYDKNGQRKYLNEKERAMFYHQLISINTHQKLFILLIFWTGVRISEALNLRADNIDLIDGVIIVYSLKKRDKVTYRHIPIPEDLLKKLKIYLKGKKSYELLWSFSRRTASRYIKKVMTKASIHGSKSCARGLRHSFAVHCVFNDIPINIIQKWMGHSSLQTTSIYLNIVGKEERKMAERMWKID